MAPRTKRKAADFDPDASDPEDLDYDVDASPKAQRRSTKSKSGLKSAGKAAAAKSSKASARPVAKRRRVVDDDDDDEDESLLDESFAGSAADEEERVEVNPATGRPARRAAKRPFTYLEVSEAGEEEEEAVEETVEGEDADAPPSKRSKAASVVKLNVNLKKLAPEEEVGGKKRGGRAASKPSRGPSEFPEGRRTRRAASRLAGPGDDGLVELTYSGHVARQKSPPAPATALERRKRGGKTLVFGKASTKARAVVGGEAAGADAAANAGDDEGAVDAPVAVSSGEEGGAAAEDDDGAVDAPVSVSSGEEEGGAAAADDDEEQPVAGSGRRSLRGDRPSGRLTRARRERGGDEGSDFVPADEEGEDESFSGDSVSSATLRRSRRNVKSGGSGRSRIVPDEDLAAEAEELVGESSSRRARPQVSREIKYEGKMGLRRRSHKPDYRILRPELQQAWEAEDEAAQADTTTRPRRVGGGGSGYRSLFPLAGPFGGAGGPPALFGDAEAAEAAGGADSDSSEAESSPRKRPAMVDGLGGATGLTPTSGGPPAFFPQGAASGDQLQVGVGKAKDRKALADADPLGVDQSVNFDGVGGLDEHVQKLKEMVMLPLMYPEMFQRVHITPPRGVLFHGPPGTGKTLLARALASSMEKDGKKVTFYMRKGADALSKWVGEAEKQLRLLFDEAKKNQPSIIFFDEIDGLAPVRSSKQEQIHASIVATLLALMDGMEGRGQVVVIGATNRPDNIDPALRRPGRFDREFYFPLPNQTARRAILDIHTKHWDPPLAPEFKDELAMYTKGYGGADIRALCTEAAINAMQGTYPQIYSSTRKLEIDITKIKVMAKDFLISIRKMVPSSERTATAAAKPLPRNIEPLLRRQLDKVVQFVQEMLPQKKKLTALEEAEYDDRDDPFAFEKETLQQDFEKSRIYRPRLLIHGTEGMGQQHLGAALLSKLENLHVQTFDLVKLSEDSGRDMSARLTELFKEVKRHQPSVIYIPNVDIWYDTIGDTAVRTFCQLLRSLNADDPIVLIGTLETKTPLNELKGDAELWAPYKDMMQNLFGYTSKSCFEVARPDEPSRRDYFATTVGYIRKRPAEFPDLENRKKRKLDVLPFATEEASVVKTPQPTKEQLKAQKKRDRYALNLLKIHIQPIMDQIRTKYKKLRTPIVEDSQLAYLYDEQDPRVLTTDLTEEQRAEHEVARPYEIWTDKHGVRGLRETATSKFYYNLDTAMVEKRLSNGYYKRPSDFVADIKRIAKDSRTSGDADRTMKANEMFANVEVDIHSLLESGQPALVAECEAIYAREQAREKQLAEKARAAALPTISDARPPPPVTPQRGVPSSRAANGGGGAPSYGSAASGLGNGKAMSFGSATSAYAAANSHVFGSAAPAIDSAGFVVPPRPAASGQPALANMLNDDGGVAEPEFLVRDERVRQLHDELALRTAGCSVEQLEQLNAAVMRVIWRLRKEPDRELMLAEIAREFNDLMADMEDVQTVSRPSQRLMMDLDPVARPGV